MADWRDNNVLLAGWKQDDADDVGKPRGEKWEEKANHTISECGLAFFLITNSWIPTRLDISILLVGCGTSVLLDAHL